VGEQRAPRGPTVDIVTRIFRCGLGQECDRGFEWFGELAGLVGLGWRSRVMAWTSRCMLMCPSLRVIML